MASELLPFMHLVSWTCLKSVLARSGIICGRFKRSAICRISRNAAIRVRSEDDIWRLKMRRVRKCACVRASMGESVIEWGKTSVHERAFWYQILKSRLSIAGSIQIDYLFWYFAEPSSLKAAAPVGIVIVVVKSLVSRGFSGPPTRELSVA